MNTPIAPIAPIAPSTPPRAAERLLAALGADPELRDVFLGDLAEEHAIRALYDGERAAARWYWREAVRVAPHLLRDAAARLRWRDAGRLLAVVLTAYVCATAAAILAARMGWDLASLVGRGGAGGAIALALLIAQNAATQVLGGYVAAALDRRRPLVAALGFGVAWSVVHLVSMLVAGHAIGWPVWLRAGQITLVVAAATLGGGIRVCTSGSRRQRA